MDHKLSIFGLGYVGAVSCACFAKLGHRVIGVDINNLKVGLINAGKAPIIEKDLEKLIKEGIDSSLIEATTDGKYAIENSDISIICVGTPSQMNGSINLSHIYKVCEEIAFALAEKDAFHTIVIRSTIIPGTIGECIKLIEELSGKKYDRDFAVVSNPEFLREGSAIEDFWHPPYTIIGADSEIARQQLKTLYEGVGAPLYFLKPEEAEIIKYASNNFHALKITFANEIGNICKELKVDGYKVMEIVSRDTKLNLSSYYLKPGFAYGGSCLPKDVRELNYKARQLDLKTPLLNSLSESNFYQIERGLQLIYNTGKRKIGVLGFSFKAGTDDLRESPIITMTETLIGKGYEVNLYDSNVFLSRLTGKNKDYIAGHVPHIAALLKSDIYEVINNSEAIVIGNNSPEFKEVIHQIDENKIIIDLVHLDGEKTSGGNYVGICW